MFRAAPQGVGTRPWLSIGQADSRATIERRKPIQKMFASE
jgi:hypothetical protein